MEKFKIRKVRITSKITFAKKIYFFQLILSDRNVSFSAHYLRVSHSMLRECPLRHCAMKLWIKNLNKRMNDMKRIRVKKKKDSELIKKLHQYANRWKTDWEIKMQIKAQVAQTNVR